MMLYILTGRIQTGKTRWLQCVVAALGEQGVPHFGVIAPGIWSRVDGVLHKDGIENVLLPEGRRLLFARCVLSGGVSSGDTRVQWDISGPAVAAVNAHFSDLIVRRQELALANNVMESQRGGCKGVLIVDELGILELQRGTGLTEAMKILELGPCSLVDNAIVVVRESLLSAMNNRFERWGMPAIIRPDKAGWSQVASLWA